MPFKWNNVIHNISDEFLNTSLLSKAIHLTFLFSLFLLFLLLFDLFDSYTFWTFHVIWYDEWMNCATKFPSKFGAKMHCNRTRQANEQTNENKHSREKECSPMPFGKYRCITVSGAVNWIGRIWSGYSYDWVWALENEKWSHAITVRWNDASLKRVRMCR